MIIGILNVFTEWQIGSSVDRHDVFPLTRIGSNEAKTVGIVSGAMRLDGMDIHPGLGDFFERTMTNINTTEILQKDHFELEPGRCVYQSLFAVSRSHLWNKIDLPPLCIKSKN